MVTSTKIDATRQRAHQQASTIEAILTKYRTSGIVTQINVKPEMIKFCLASRVGTKVSKIATHAEEIATALGAREARIYRQGASIAIDVKIQSPERAAFYPLAQTLCTDTPGHSCLLGLDAKNQSLLLRLTGAHIGHVLVTGEKDEHNSAIVLSMAASLAMLNAQRSAQITMIGPPRSTLNDIMPLPHFIGPVADTQEDAIIRLEWLTRVIERRKSTKNHSDNPIVLLIIDKLEDVTSNPELDKLFTNVAKKGIEHGIHIVATTTKPRADTIGTGTVCNFSTRIVGQVASRDHARYATGIADSGAEQLASDEHMLLTRSHLIEFTRTVIGQDDIHSVLKHIRQPRPN